MQGRLIKRHGAASAEVSHAMAEAARARFGADVGVAITPRAKEPAVSQDVAGTCYIGFAVNVGVSSTSGRYPTHRGVIRARAASHVLTELARALNG